MTKEEARRVATAVVYKLMCDCQQKGRTKEDVKLILATTREYIAECERVENLHYEEQK